jgi:uncharacterized surface protein with fasciclin (FAS1) repeats
MSAIRYQTIVQERMYPMKTVRLLLVSLISLFAFAQEPATVVDLAADNPDFSTLVELLSEAGQVELLSGEGPFTVFAPTNAAFEALPPGLLDGIRSSSISLQSVLSYHVIRGAVTAEAVLALEGVGGDGAQVPTLLGAPLTISVNAEGQVVINGTATVIATDITAGNGVVHVIDAVLVPERP